MRLFLDTSVLLSGAASAIGASREIFILAAPNDWVLVATPYVVAEVLRNLPEFPAQATADWVRLRSQLLVMDDVLTLDRKDFGGLLDTKFYGLPVLKPGTFIAHERTIGRLKSQ